MFIAADFEKAHRQLEEILAKPEYGRQTTTLPQFHLPGWMNSSLLEDTMLGIFILFLCCLVLGIGWILLRYWMKRVKKGPVHEETPEQEIPWLEKAERYAGLGDYRFAVRALYHYVLFYTYKRRKLEELPGQTNGEQRDQISQTWPEKASLFCRLSQRFDEIWYGHMRIEPAEYERYLEGAMKFAESGNKDAEE
ncbi:MULTISPECIES: DUF4129 domain-containing protein [unclassified Thermoactinomyces]|uniref:DUF4129 domain-containing protein n=1 Tax=unclassified Thermoactinomyces TaxID=2634588 RepID=UPI0018DD0390|nr:DUF4129 domain-containing protein [Thermoactinomyces sp. CICC 10523]MBH8605164.1 DUF4129 domain-containing protein [Thermoactinomyces sp. CICC 10522]MBH8608296.1 DUF4129 domain-containing protein [Thermoactinomyces sp. CICC 10521]